MAGRMDNLTTALTRVSADFRGALTQPTTPAFEAFVRDRDTATKSELLYMIGSPPGVTEITDEMERKISDLLARDFRVRYRKFASTFRVAEDDLLDGVLADLPDTVVELANKVRNFSKRLVLETLESATIMGIDGVPLISTAHAFGSSGNQSNVNSGTGTGLSAIMADFIAMETAIMGYNDDQGDTIDWGTDGLQFDVICTRTLLNTFEQLRDHDLVWNGTAMITNVIKSKIRNVVVMNRTNAGRWCGVVVGAVRTPFLRNRRQSPDLKCVTPEGAGTSPMLGIQTGGKEILEDTVIIGSAFKEAVVPYDYRTIYEVRN